MSEVEGVKRNSNKLRGTIKETLASGATHFEGPNANLIKFHGMYQEDDRDERSARMKAKQDPKHILMVRTKIPGGQVTAEQYLALDGMADKLANGTLRITTRQDIQFHGVLMSGVKELIAAISHARLTTFGGCGDVERNIMCTAIPRKTAMHAELFETAKAISNALLPKTNAYFQIWLDGEKLKLEDEPAIDPIYTDAYLPRKFKTAMMIPPDNDVDIHAHDLGFVAHLKDGAIEGYTVLAGGGFGMDHGKKATYPFLAVPLFYVKKEHAMEAAKAVITFFRDYGDRGDRKHARLKYVIAEKGIEFVRTRIKWRINCPVEDPRPFTLGSIEDKLGWHDQGDGKRFCGVRVEYGRIKDFENGPRYRSAFRALTQRFKAPIRFTPNQNIVFGDLNPGDKAAFDAILKEHGIPFAETLTQARKMSIACVALPTCHLALSESERAMPGLMDEIDALLRELKLEQEHILFRMTGCPNGCARPYNADFAFVGRGPEKYAVYIGGSYRGDRMAGLAFRSVNVEEIAAKIRPFLEQYVGKRTPGETFTDYWGRTHANGPAPHPDQFHEELEERAKRLGSAARKDYAAG
ncbi:MAG: NADPH-dependent assimilatory sulfite reductase hemoprotein subunit [Planctomycetes bacterium]|nr:NADPH-dependent assimilatory sulfite reductase hemoprotein subunit [Planctomycetota bacterium]